MGIILVPVHPQKGQTPLDCVIKAQRQGAQTYDEFGTACWAVYGKVVPITPTDADIMKGFVITNFNFHVVSVQRPLPGATDLPGPMDDSLGPDSGGNGYDAASGTNKA